MVYRKLIGFGDSSFVISLPKEWVNKNGLKKGDVINLEEDSAFIKISPLHLKQSNDEREMTIEFEGDIKKLNSELVYAYIENYKLINIVGRDLFSSVDKIKDVVENLVALEIVQKGPQKIVIKDFLNVQDVSVYDTLRRIDRITLSMAEDVKNFLLAKNLKVLEILEHKEKDINRLSNLVFKTLKKAFNPSDRSILKLDLDDIFYYWELNLFIEKIGDQLKRIPRYVSSNPDPLVIEVFDSVIAQYSDAMKANFTKNYSIAISVITKKREIYNAAEKCLISSNPVSNIFVEKVKNIADYSGNIAKALLKLRLENKKN